MNDLTTQAHGGESPFDAIRRTRLDGTEYWSARDLCDLAGYVEWRKFEGAVDRAMLSAQNQGYVIDDHFVPSAKKVSVGSNAERTINDWHLSRFASYLVFQNGDPRKTEIANAQGYFAVKTRQAEVQQQPLDEIEVAERYLTALKEKKALAERVKALEGPAMEREAYRAAEGLQLLGDVANQLKIFAASNHPTVKVYQRDVFDLAGRLGIIIRGNTVRHNQPTARAIEAGWAKAKDSEFETNHGPRVNVSTRLTPRGYSRLWDAAVNNLTEHECVLPPVKELVA